MAQETGERTNKKSRVKEILEEQREIKERRDNAIHEHSNWRQKIAFRHRYT